MKRFNREINVFNLAAIDLFASAMGAFMLISLLAIPYYLNQEFLSERIAQLLADAESIQAETERVEEAIEETQEETSEQQERLEELQEESREQAEEIEDMRRELSKTILAVMINWYTTADIDLHVFTPTGHHYNYNEHNRRGIGGGPRPNWPDEEAELSFDAGAAITGKAGMEVWTMANTPEGEYRVVVNKYASKGDDAPTRVELAILCGDRVERKVIPGVTGETEVAVIRISAGRRTTVEWR